jgi:hypothetical protein
MGAGEEGDGGGGHDAGAFKRAPAAQAGGESGGDPGAGFAGVAAEKTAGSRLSFAQGVAEGQADGEDGGGVERKFAGDGANAVGAEELA